VEEIKSDKKNALAMGPFGSNITTDNFVSSGVPVIRGINLAENKFTEENFVYLTEEKANQLLSATALPGDIVFTHRGTIGQVGIIPFDARYPRYVVSQSQMKLSCDTKKVDPYFVYYYFISPAGQHELLSHTSTTGVPALAQPLTSLKQISILLPGIDKQKKVASILQSLDKKIMVIYNTIRILEKIIQTIFTSWFIHFEFPNDKGKPYKLSGGEMISSRLGMIPANWNVKKLGDVVKIYDSKRVPLSSLVRSTRKGSYPYYGAASIIDYIDDYIFDGTYVLLAEDGTVIDEVDHPYVQYVQGKFWVNNHAHVLQGTDEISTEYLDLYLRRLNIRPWITGAVQLKINQTNLVNIPIIVPDSNILGYANKILKSMYDSMIISKNMIESLTKLRDLLIPKLISGEIRI
jgi:type I restriction enzyme S subunit